MGQGPILRAIDAVTVPVPDLDQGLAYYRDQLGHEVIWRNDDVGQVALRLPESSAELVLTTHHNYEPNWLVDSVPQAVAAMVSGGGRVIVEEGQIPVGRLAVVADPFGNPLVLLDLSAGTYLTDQDQHVIGVVDGSLRWPPSHHRTGRFAGPSGDGLADARSTGGEISTEPRVNDRIRAPEVRLVGPGGEQVGVVKIETALQLAREAGLDLVEVAPMARPPVAKLMAYPKFKSESDQKVRESRRNDINTVIKEIRGREEP